MPHEALLALVEMFREQLSQMAGGRKLTLPNWRIFPAKENPRNGRLALGPQ